MGTEIISQEQVNLIKLRNKHQCIKCKTRVYMAVNFYIHAQCGCIRTKYKFQW